jgi:hypothetical protein
VNFNSEIANEWARPVSRRAPLPRDRHTPRRRSSLKPLSGQRVARPDSCLTCAAPDSVTSPSRPSPRRACPLADRRLAPHAASRPPPRTCRRRPNSCLALAAPLPTASPVAVARPPSPVVVACRRLRAGEPPPPSSPVRVGRADAAGVGQAHSASGPSANSAQCTRLILLISDLFNSLQIQKLCRIHLNSENYETNFVGNV